MNTARLIRVVFKSLWPGIINETVEGKLHKYVGALLMKFEYL